MNVREYSSDGPGKLKTNNHTGYPLELPGTDLQHLVQSMGKNPIIISHY